jgi:Undecaprenyl-phosphate galactose phosphotransferase WbaP
MSTNILAIKRVSALSAPLINNPHRPGISAMLVLVADVVVLWLTLRVFFGNQPLVMGYTGTAVHLLPLIIVFLVLYFICDLYPGICVSPVDEIRRIFVANISSCFFISVGLVMHNRSLRLQPACIGACVAACFTLAIFRRGIRRFASRFSWWGYPVAVFGGGEVAISVLRKLKTQSYLGLRPVALVTDRIAERHIDGVAVCRFEHLHRILSSRVKHALVAAPELSETEFAEMLEGSQYAFPHMIIIPDTHFLWRVGAYTRDFMGTLGLQVRNNLLRPGSRIAKRIIDLGLCALLSPILLPLIAVIYVVIVADSGFPVFYSQKRLGHGARTFDIWKFRTMVRNAAEVLQHTLASDPELRKEWLQNQKLRKDPRITAIGKLLRKTSLDELPQFWNVIKGEMSLVGPRPIVQEEVAKYKQAYRIYTKTTPGVTGLWQVSGRNHTTYAERVAYDSYYVRNWSVWMDIYLLARTVSVILTGSGAY